MKNLNFDNANSAFNYLYHYISCEGEEFDGTQAIFNVGFYLINPTDNIISIPFRKWNRKYAKAEWDWYLSEDPKVKTLGDIFGKVPKIWSDMADDKGEVNSNYGYQWSRGHQLDRVVAILKNNPNTRKATISIYDGKEIQDYKQDTPCTYAVQFTILNNRLNMCVTMRSNDLWFGFCNDQYCFSELQKVVAERLSISIGTYYHFAHNMHLYARDIGKNKMNTSTKQHERYLRNINKQYN